MALEVNPALEHLSEIIGEVLEEETGSGRKKKRGHQQGLAANMRETTKETVASRLGVGTKEMFILTVGQLATLDGLSEQGEDAAPLVRSLNGMTKPRGAMYQEREAIETVQTMPGTRPEPGAKPEPGTKPEPGAKGESGRGNPDWKGWWLDNLNESPGVHRPQEECGKECKLLRETIRAMGVQAIRDMPEYQDIAVRMKGRSRKPAGLCEIYRASRRILDTAKRMLVTQGEMTGAETPGRPREADLPEDIAAHLRAAGTNFGWDMGTVRDLPEMRATAGGRRIKDMDVEVLPGGQVAWRDRKQWSGTNLDQGWEMHGGTEQEPPGPQGAERELIWHLCPPVPANRWHFTRKLKLHLFAEAVGNTPKNVEEFIDGRDSEPGSPPPASVCPQADACATGCARVQLEGRAERPPTYDGRWESCGYRRFLENYRAAPQEIRDAAAEEICQEMDRERNLLQKQGAKGVDQDGHEPGEYEPGEYDRGRRDPDQYEWEEEKVLKEPPKGRKRDEQQVMF